MLFFFLFLGFGNFLKKGARSSLKEDLVSFFYSGRVREHRERLSWHHSKRKLSKKRERGRKAFSSFYFLMMRADGQPSLIGRSPFSFANISRRNRRGMCYYIIVGKASTQSTSRWGVLYKIFCRVPLSY